MIIINIAPICNKNIYNILFFLRNNNNYININNILVKKHFDYISNNFVMCMKSTVKHF